MCQFWTQRCALLEVSPLQGKSTIQIKLWRSIKGKECSESWMNWNTCVTTWIPQEQSLFLCQRISTSIRVRINPVRSGRGPNGSCIFNGFPLDENHWAGTGVLHVGSIPAQLYIYLTQTPITMHRDTSRFQRGADGLSLNVFLSSRIISFYSDYHIPTSTLVAMEYVYTMIRLLIDEAEFCYEQEKPCHIRHHYDFCKWSRWSNHQLEFKCCDALAWQFQWSCVS